MIQRFFANPDVDYIHAHNARRGCYAGRIDRDLTSGPGLGEASSREILFTGEKYEMFALSGSIPAT